jgi:hypothetical protein
MAAILCALSACATRKRNTVVLFVGPSAYDGATIRVLLTFKSRNGKTGPMAQLTIIRDDLDPVHACKFGEDFSVCGRCPLRANGCYVNVSRSILAMWKATNGLPADLAGGLARLAASGLPVRLGAYGDPAAIPPEVFAAIRSACTGGVTGYTHGALLKGFDGIAHLRDSCMISAESETYASHAHAAGFRTFRTRAPGAALMAREIDCPSERISCAQCRLCCGASSKAKSISIPVHGSQSRKALAVLAAA